MFWRRRRDAAHEAPVAPDPGAAPDAPLEEGDSPSGAPPAGAIAPSEDGDRIALPEDVRTVAPLEEANGSPEPTPVAALPATLDTGVEPSRRGFVSRLRGLLRRGVDEETWEEVEETLIAADVGAELALDVVARARRRDAEGPEDAVRAELEALLAAPGGANGQGPWRPRRPDASFPAVILVVGVNGTGKTTTIAKLAFRLRQQGDSVLLAAADTFRAAAIEQLRTWADRIPVPVIAHAPGADPSAVVYDALDASVARGIDVVIADTAGRLHTKSNLMDELNKIRRTIDKRLPGSMPEVLFVLDATTGQNGLAQAKAFHASAGLTGVVLTKLDSTARGGIVFSIERTLGVPVRFVGVGEGLADLVDFDPRRFVEALFA